MLNFTDKMYTLGDKSVSFLPANIESSSAYSYPHRQLDKVTIISSDIFCYMEKYIEISMKVLSI